MDRETLAEQLRRARFRTTQLRQGYDEGEVDAFLDRLDALLRSAEPAEQVTSAVDGARFRTTSLGRGYDMADVDAALEQVVEALASGTADGPVGPGADAASPAADTSASTPASRRSDASGVLPSAVVEPRPGLLSRLGRVLRGD